MAIGNPFKGDPLSSGMPSLEDGGMGDEALESHMAAFLKAMKAGDTKGMATAFRASSDACYAGAEPDADEPMPV